MADLTKSGETLTAGDNALGTDNPPEPPKPKPAPKKDTQLWVVDDQGRHVTTSVLTVYTDADHEEEPIRFAGGTAKVDAKTAKRLIEDKTLGVEVVDREPRF